MSKNLSAVLAGYQADSQIELRILAARLAQLFNGKTQEATALLKPATGTMAPGTLCRHLFDYLPHDSVVRDILTAGHLAKLLSRIDMLKRTSDPRVIGLPSALFDARSQVERTEFFERGNILPIDAEVLAASAVKEMLDREAAAR